MTDDFQTYVEQMQEADRLARKAKETVFFKLAKELGYAVSKITPWGESAAPPPEQPTCEEVDPEEVKSEETQPPAPEAAAYDGTFGGLIDSYRTNEKSKYFKLKYRVRLGYDNQLKHIVRTIGSEKVADWTSERAQRAYDGWIEGGKLATGHTRIGMLRLLCTFGSNVLNDKSCMFLSTILRGMRFPLSSSSNEVISLEHVRAIRATAHEHFNWPSIALAQAFQYSLPMLAQADVLGEWVPMSEPGTSDITKGNEKWLRGLRWSDIDENMIFRRSLTFRSGKTRDLVINLKHKAMIMEEINRVPPWKRTGPMIVCEYSDLPWSAVEFRRKWRLVANEAGVPKTVRNMDSNMRPKAKESDDNNEDLRADAF